MYLQRVPIAVTSRQAQAAAAAYHSLLPGFRRAIPPPPWRSQCPLGRYHQRFASSFPTPPPSPPVVSEQSSSTSSSLPESPSASPSAQPENLEDRFSSAASEELLSSPASTRQAIGKIERRLSITFTCTVPNCGYRSSHEFSRHAYEKGIVLVQCPGCDTRHLIADHLGWFNSDDLTQGGKFKTIEALLESRGEKVAKAIVQPDGTIEVDTPDEEDTQPPPQ